MSVWKRVRQYAKDKVTSIIHGKAWHEETKATSSQATRQRQRALPGGLHAGGNGLRLRLHRQRRQQGGVPGEIQRRLLRRVRSRPASAGHRRGQPNHHAARRNRGGAAPACAAPWSEVRRGGTRPGTSASSTPSAARRRTGRTRWRNCCANRWTCCSSSAATIPRTRRTWRRWARPSCRPTSSRTPPRWCRTS